MSASDRRVRPARANGIEMIVATQIRRPCNRTPGRVVSVSVTFVAAIKGKNDLVEYLKSL